MKKVLIALISVIILAVLALGGFVIWNLSKKIDKLSENISGLTNGNNEAVVETNNVVTNNTVSNQVVSNNTVTNQTQTTGNNVVSNQTTVATMEEQVKNAYAKLLSQRENIVEYKIDSVTILTDEQKKSLLEYDKGQNYKETDTLAVVGYAIKLKDGAIEAGNGRVEGDWVVNKSACICYRDGQIVSDGTGW